MTDTELDEVERMWADGVPVADIASSMCYSESYIRHVACEHRDRLPYRSRSLPIETRKEWVSRIMAGDATVADAARELGVAKVTVRRWMVNRMRGKI